MIQKTLTATEILGKATYDAKQLRISMGTAFVENTGWKFSLSFFLR